MLYPSRLQTLKALKTHTLKLENIAEHMKRINRF